MEEQAESSSKLILGIDPGLKTGMVVLSEGSVDWYGEILFDEVHEVLHDLIPFVTLVAIERYTISMRTIQLSRQYEALYTIGMTVMLTTINKVELTFQSPADAKSAFEDEHLEEIGMYDVVKGGHARDALRHALLAKRRYRL